MRHAPPSALITDRGQRVMFRIDGRVHEMTFAELRAMLGLPPASPGLGITIDRNRLTFEFAADDSSIALTEAQLRRRLAKRIGTR